MDVDQAGRVSRVTRDIAVLSVVLLLVARLLDPALVTHLGLPIAIAGVLVGIPHGAVDHLVPFWSRSEPITARALAGVLAGYLVTAALALVVLLAVPTVAVTVFLVVSALHFGRGEVVAAAQTAGRRVPRGTQDALPALAHGAVTVAGPLVLWPQLSLPVLGALAAPLGRIPGSVLHGLLTGTAGLVVAASLLLVRRGRAREAAELLLLVALFVLVPPLPAFGVYFGLWHAVRHTARLIVLPGPAGSAVSVRQGLLRYARNAAAPTAVACGLLAVLWTTTTPTVLGAALATLLALTFPHVRVVAQLDRLASA